MIRGYYEIEGGKKYGQIAVLGKLCDMISEKKIFDFVVIDNSTLRDRPNNTKCKYGPFNLVIENSENGKFFLISYMDHLDWIKDTKTFFGNDEFDNLSKCVEILATTGRHTDLKFFQPTDIIATPISNVCGEIVTEDFVQEYYKKKGVKKIIHEKPTFYGYLYDFRLFLSDDKRFDMRPAQLDIKNYIEDLHRQKLCFSLNGGEISPRDIEIMGLGNAIIRPKFISTKTHNPLIPNFHYIAVENEDIPIIKNNDSDNHKEYWKELSDRIIDRYYEVKKDEEFIDFIGNNGRKWFEENGTIQKATEIIYNLLDFSKLE